MPIERTMSLDLRNALYHGNYERGEMLALQATLEADDVVMEMGTGLGFLAAFAAKVVGSEHVATYEANPELKPLIERTFRLNGVAPRITNAILADHVGQTDFFIEPLFYNSSTTPGRDAKRISVRTAPLREEMHLIKPTFVIMDVEGSETDLIPMMDLSTVNKFLLEVHPHIVGDTRIVALVRLVESQGLARQPRLSRGDQLFFRREGT